MRAKNGTGLADLKGKVAIVTGGGRGIGQAIAIALAESGIKVVVAARSEDQLVQTVDAIEQAGGQALAYQLDVTEQQSVEDMVDFVELEFGPVDILVNNAGVSGPGGPIWETNPEEWWWCFNVNLRGPFLCARAVLPGMVARKQGCIITVASGAGLGPQPFISAYGTSKTAAIRFIETLADEVKAHNVAVFAIGPGLVRTAMTEAAAASSVDEEFLGGWFKKSLEEKRDIPPDRAAQLVLSLVSGKAQALSGTFISVHQNLEDLLQRANEIQESSLLRLRLRG